MTAVVLEQDRLRLAAWFVDAWKGSGRAVTLLQTNPAADGIDATVDCDDPFVGNTRGSFHFGWSEVVRALFDERQFDWLSDSVHEWIAEDAEPDGDGYLVYDDDGRVHFRSDFEED